MSPRLSAEAMALLRAQRFIVATWQGPSVGLAPRAMRRAARGGTWTRVTGRTFLALATEPDHAQQRVAGTLELGRTALLGGLAALAERGWKGDTGPWVDVVVPRDAVASDRDVPGWLRIHRRSQARDVPGVVPLVAAAEAVVDAAGWARTAREAMFVAVSALQQRIVTPDALAGAVAARTRRPRARVVADIVAEFRSV